MSRESRGEALHRLLELQDLESAGCELRRDEALSKHTTLRLGGPADLWARPQDASQLIELLARAHRCGVPARALGGGTNLLVRDGGLRGLTVNLARMNRVWRPDETCEPERVLVEAGASTGRLLKAALGWGLGGLEFLGGVPGSVGGGLIMNAGTYLGEFTDVVVHVDSVDLQGTRRRRAHAECGFRYRDSDLPKDEVVVGAELRLRPRPREEMDEEIAALRKRRREREPKGVPNNGSTFKNPEGDYAGRLIETAGLKGLRQGGAMVSDVHANWLVVDREVQPPCRSRDLLALIEVVRERVQRAHGVRLDLEVKVVGED